MKIKHNVMTSTNYKGHTITKTEDEFGNVLVFIDNDKGWHETAPINMNDDDFWYASIADAKRFINGQKMIYLPCFIDDWNDAFKARYMNRFKREV